MKFEQFALADKWRKDLREAGKIQGRNLSVLAWVETETWTNSSNTKEVELLGTGDLTNKGEERSQNDSLTLDMGHHLDDGA